MLTLPPAGPTGKSEFQVNGVPFWKAKPFLATLGETQIWTVKNDSKFAHPFHLHGFFFLPLDDRLQPIHPMAWKDTVNVPIDGTIASRACSTNGRACGCSIATSSITPTAG